APALYVTALLLFHENRPLVRPTADSTGLFYFVDTLSEAEKNSPAVARAPPSVRDKVRWAQIRGVW
ncbi:hypothetical protein ACO2Q2_10180, partial [Dyella sp. KRB-257]|uniref:hypothetical protein n=1 Tax=Dyella sp. KRB-257 TaxID=3400915 RepID=UPI003C010449